MLRGESARTRMLTAHEWFSGLSQRPLCELQAPWDFNAKDRKC